VQDATAVSRCVVYAVLSDTTQTWPLDAEFGPHDVLVESGVLCWVGVWVGSAVGVVSE